MEFCFLIVFGKTLGSTVQFFGHDLGLGPVTRRDRAYVHIFIYVHRYTFEHKHQEEDTPSAGAEETETNRLVHAKIAKGGELRAYLIQAKRLASERSSGLPDRWEQY